MHHHNTTWISTVANTGTQWTFNVVREIYNSQRYNVLPKRALKDYKRYLNIYKNEALNDYDSNNHYVMSCHAPLQLYLPRTKFITNLRNPYDNCASYYEFMKCSVDDAIACAKNIPLLIQHYSNLKKEKLFILRFEDIDEKPQSLIKKIAKFLGFDLPETEIRKIVNKYSRGKIRLMIQENDRSLSQRITSGEEIDQEDVVIRDGGNRIDSFDINTGYLSNHISKRKNGEWKLAFSCSQIEKIISSLDETAKMLGYGSEKSV